MRNLAYYKINYLTPIYLEYAPIGILTELKQSDSEQQDAAGDDVQDRQQRQIFIKNLNFNTREEQLETIFKQAGL